MWISNFPSTIYWKDSLFLIGYSQFLHQILILVEHIHVGSFLYPVVLIYVSAFMPLPYCFDYHMLIYRLKSGNVMPPIFFFFLKIALAVLGLFGSIWIFELFFLFLWKIIIGILIKMTLSSMGILVILIFPIHEQRIFFHLFASSSISSSSALVFSVWIFHFLS